jgi:hypothetical protein
MMDNSMSTEDFVDIPLTLKDDDILRQLNPCVDAVYHDSSLELPENADNPLALALPPFGDMRSIANGMTIAFAVAHASSFRTWSLPKRLLGIERISRVLVLTASHLQMLDWLHIALRHRYRGLLPTRSLRERAQANYVRTQDGIATPLTQPGDSHSECLSVFGISGAGKTTLVKMVLSTFPMIIEHREYRGVATRFVQVVWVCVSCPANASVRSLMKGILHWFDLHLGTHYVKEVGIRANTDDYIAKVEYVLARRMTGVLVIDEIQHAFKSAEKTLLMGFLTNLLNSNCCIFILLGTPEARRYVTRSLRNARRAISGGLIVLDPCPIDEDWVRLATAICTIDFLPQPPDDLREIIEVLYEVSAGSPAFGKLAWRLTQYAGLRGDESKVTPSLIRGAVKETFAPVAGLLEALRTKQYDVLSQYEDMATAAVDTVRERLEMDRRRRELRLDFKHDAFTAIFSSCVAMLVEMGKSQNEAESVVRRILSNEPGLSALEVIRRALVPEEDDNVSPKFRKVIGS